MGLFSRSSPDDNRDDYDAVELPTRDDLDDTVLESNEPSFDVSPAAASKSRPTKRDYGIEEAIELMQSLPRDNHEVVVTVVKKTLESTNIQVNDIIEDAAAKEERLRKRHKDLEAEIKQLQDKITQRNQQINELTQDLKQTTDVRKRLELALELDKKSQSQQQSSPQSKPRQEAAPAAESDSKPSPAETKTNPGGTAPASASSTAEKSSATGPQTAVRQSTGTEARPGQQRAATPNQHKNPSK